MCQAAVSRLRLARDSTKRQSLKQSCTADDMKKTFDDRDMMSRHETDWISREHVGMKLLKIREKTGLTQEQFADKIGTLGANVSAWETGRRMPSIFNLRRYAVFGEIDWDEFFDLQRNDGK